MKKFILLICLLLTISCTLGCAKTIYHKDWFDSSTGKVIASEDFTMSRPIFAAMSAGKSGETINMNSGSSIQLDQLMSMALQGYAKYMSGGLVPTPTPTPTTGPIVTEVTP